MKDLEFNWDKITGALGKEGENIFKTEVGKIENLCNGYDDKKDNSNIICIVGNRGCGKTSLINAVREKLNKNKNFFVTDIIDPSIFDDTLSISEFFISVLAEEVRKYKEEKESNNFENKTEGKYIRFNKKLNDIMDVISHIKSNKERFYEDTCASDIVKNIQKRSNFAALLKELIEAFYGVLGKDQKTKMVVCIDDLDLVANQYVYQMIEDIQKWLNKNCIVILSFREIQLLNIIQDHFIQQNKNLMDKQIVSIAEIKDQTVQFYEKQMPVSRRIYLKGQKEYFTDKAWDILEPFAVKVGNESSLEEENEYEKTNLHDLMEDLVRKKLALPLDPVDEKEKVHLIYPNGLREMLAFIRMLREMDIIHDDNKNDIKKEKLQDNLKKYREYILSRAKANLNMEYYSILEEWLKTSVRNKNYYICSKLDGILKKKTGIDYHSDDALNLPDSSVEDNNAEDDDVPEEEIPSSEKDRRVYKTRFNWEKIQEERKGLIYIEYTDTYNVTIGDVFQSLETVKSFFHSDERSMYFIYLIKLLYSIELLFSFLDIQSVNEKTNYSLLINGKFMPDNFMYTSRSENCIDYISANVDPDDENVRELITAIIYSNVKRNSSAWQAARPRSTKFYSLYSHRPLFEPEFSLEQSPDGYIKANYKTDPLTAVLKKEYLTDLLTDILAKESQEKKYRYVFYSMFDIDAVMRMTFDNKKERKLYHLYNKINWIYNGNDNDASVRSEHDVLLKKKISQLFCKKNIELKPVFKDSLMNKIREIDKKRPKRGRRQKSLSEKTTENMTEENEKS